jgi:hypothetical protein
VPSAPGSLTQVSAPRWSTGILTSPSQHRGRRYWVKTKCSNWKRENERHRLFENNKKSEPRERELELQKKKAELARVLERLGAADVRPGLAKELRGHVATLEREIAEMEQP